MNKKIFKWILVFSFILLLFTFIWDPFNLSDSAWYTLCYYLGIISAVIFLIIAVINLYIEWNKYRKINNSLIAEITGSILVLLSIIGGAYYADNLSKEKDKKSDIQLDSLRKNFLEFSFELDSIKSDSSRRRDTLVISKTDIVSKKDTLIVLNQGPNQIQNFRNISNDGRNLFIKELNKIKKDTIQVVCINEDAEACNFSRQIAQIFASSGWITYNNSIYVFPQWRGISVHIRNENYKSEAEFISKLFYLIGFNSNTVVNRFIHTNYRIEIGLH